MRLILTRGGAALGRAVGPPPAGEGVGLYAGPELLTGSVSLRPHELLRDPAIGHRRESPELNLWIRVDERWLIQRCASQLPVRSEGHLRDGAGHEARPGQIGPCDVDAAGHIPADAVALGDEALRRLSRAYERLG